MRTSSLLCALVLTLSASATAQVRRDSAGIAIFTNARPTAAGSVRLGTSPTLVIGAQSADTDAEYQFRSIAGVVMLADGGIAVADGQSRQIRFFDRRGRYVRSIGGRGGGPGEFRDLQSFARLSPDTLVAGDFNAASYFTSAGTFAFRVQAMQPIDAPPVGPRFILASLRGGNSVVMSYRPPTPRSVGTTWIDSLPLLWLTPSSSVVKAKRNVPAFTYGMQAREATPLRLGPQAVYATNGTDFFLGFGNQFSISVYSADGELVRIIRRAWTPILTRGSRAVREMGDGPFADTVAAYSQFIADRVGGLWVRSVNLADKPPIGGLDLHPRGPSVWSLFDASSRWITDVTMPARFAPKEIGADYVLGVLLDDDDVEMVARYPLLRSGRE